MQYLVIPGKPVPKARARVRFYDGRVMSYTPPKTREFEKAIRVYASHAGVRLQRGRLATVMIFQTNGPGDIDNLIKSVHDGLNKIAWEDDRQIKAVLAIKLPIEKGNECTEVLIVDFERFKSVIKGIIGLLLLEANAKRKGDAV